MVYGLITAQGIKDVHPSLTIFFTNGCGSDFLTSIFGGVIGEKGLFLERLEVPLPEEVDVDRPLCL